MFKTIKSHPNYEINEEGVVRNSVTCKILKSSIGKSHGYPVVTLFDGYGKGKTCTIHRLVALTFIPNPENKPCVDHIDYDRTNHCVSNLRWVTYTENNIHSSCGVKAYKIQKDGVVYEGANLKEWCRENGMLKDYKMLSAVNKGTRKSSRGYTKA